MSGPTTRWTRLRRWSADRRADAVAVARTARPWQRLVALVVAGAALLLPAQMVVYTAAGTTETRAVVAFVEVEPEAAGDRREHLLGRLRPPLLLEARVVVGGHAAQRGDLLASQPVRATPRPARWPGFAASRPPPAPRSWSGSPLRRSPASAPRPSAARPGR